MQKLRHIIIGFFGVEFVGIVLAFFRYKDSKLMIKQLKKLQSKNDFKALKIEDLAEFPTKYFCSNPRYINNVSSAAELKHVADFKNYVLSIENVIIIGDSNLLLLNNNKDLAYISTVVDNENSKIIDSAIVAQIRKISFLSVNKNVKYYHHGINFVGYNSDNYYHLLYEIMAKFEYLHLLNIDNEMPLVFDSAIIEVPQYLELISFFNKNDRKILYVKKNTLCHFKYLIHTTTPNFIPSYFKDLQQIKARHVLFSPSNLDFLNNSLKSREIMKDYPTKLYLSRRISSKRRQFNEVEIETYLKSKGYFSLNPNEYSIQEQLQFFYNAKIIIGGSGAAFSNIIVCKEHCKIICLSNYQLDISIFSTIASVKNLDLIYISDKTLICDKKSDLHDSFHIEVSDLVKYA